MSTAALIFAGLVVFVSATILALAIYTRPLPERPCTMCLHYDTSGGKPTRDTACTAGGTCGSQRQPSPWVPIMLTGRCGPGGRFWAAR